MNALPLLALAVLASCATPEPRYLTIEEDRQVRETCEPHGGRVMVPVPLMERIMRALKGVRAS